MARSHTLKKAAKSMRGEVLALYRSLLRGLRTYPSKRRAALVEETRAIEAASGFGPTASSAIGYAEVLQLLAGELAADELATRIARSTHRLVRRQETWLRRFPGLRRVSTSTPETTCVLDPLFDDA